jgi:hypothetical protein
LIETLAAEARACELHPLLLKILPRISVQMEDLNKNPAKDFSVQRISMVSFVVCHAVVNGSLGIAARATSFLFD